MQWIYVKGIVEEDVTAFASTGTTISRNHDKTLDDGQIVLLLSSGDSLKQEDGYFIYASDGGDRLLFDVISDDVKIAQRGDDEAFCHTVQLIAVSRRFYFHLAKGMDFTQARSAYSMCDYSQFVYDDGTENQIHTFGDYETTVSLGDKEKISSASISISAFATKMQAGSTTSSTMSRGTFSIANVRVYAVIDSAKTLLFRIDGPFSDGDEIVLSEAQIAIMRANRTHPIGVNCDGINSLGTITPTPYFSTSADAGFATFDIKLTIDRYYYTYLDVLGQIIRGCDIPDTDGVNQTRIANLPESGEFYDFLNGSVSPNFQFTQGETLWDCLVKVYDSFDAKPIVSGISSGVPILGVEYYSELKNQMSQEFVAFGSSLSDERRADGLVCRYQNGSTKSLAYYPAKGSSARVRAKNLGVPSNNDYQLVAGTGIQSVSEAFGSVYYFGISGSTAFPLSGMNVYVSQEVLADLMPCVYEKSAWSILDVSTEQTFRATQRNTFWYSEGSDSVYVGALNQNVNGQEYSYKMAFERAVALMIGASQYYASQGFVLADSDEYGSHYFITPDSVLVAEGDNGLKPWLIKMGVGYVPKINGCVRVESAYPKRLGETLVNQSSALTDLSKLGSNMYGLALKLGEESRFRTFTIGTFDEMPKIGSYYRDSDGLWVVQKAKATIYADGAKCDLELSKNYNQLSQRIAVERQVTFNGISQSLVLDSETVYQEYVSLYGQTMRNSGYSPSPTATKALDKRFTASLFSALDYLYQPISVDYAVFRSKTLGVYSSPCYMPLISYGAGNALCIEGGFSDPISAGNELSSAPSGWITSVNSNALPYANPYGFADYADVWLCAKGDADVSGAPSMPIPSQSPVYLQTARIEKRPNDVFRMNYETILVPDSKDGSIVPYPNLVSESFLCLRESRPPVRFFLNPEGGIPYSGFETMAYGNEVISEGGSFRMAIEADDPVGAGMQKGSLKLYLGSSEYHAIEQDGMIGWMVSDCDGVPLLASNGNSSNGTSVAVYYYATHKRPPK